MVTVAVALPGLVLVMRGRRRAAAVVLVLHRLCVMADNVVVSGAPGEVLGQFGMVNPWLESVGGPVFALLLLAAVSVAQPRRGAPAP